MLFGKGNRLLSFGYYALNKNEGIPYGSLKIARKKTFLQWIEGFFFGMEISWPVSSGSSKSAFFLQKLSGSVHFLKRISNISYTAKFFPLKVADLENKGFQSTIFQGWSVYRKIS